MNFKNDIAGHSKRMSAEAYVDRFENRFDDYIEGIAKVIVLSDASSAKHIIQALINSYHDLGKPISPIAIPHFATLQMFVKLTGASLEHSGVDESLKIIEQAK